MRYKGEISSLPPLFVIPLHTLQPRLTWNGDSLTRESTEVLCWLIFTFNHLIMVFSFPIEFVTHHLNQTHLVDTLLKKGMVEFCDISGYEDDESGCYPDIYQWLVFPKLWSDHYVQLEEAKIPVIDTDYGTWVGITSFGSHYDLYVYPSLIHAIFWEKAWREFIDFRDKKIA